MRGAGAVGRETAGPPEYASGFRAVAQVRNKDPKNSFSVLFRESRNDTRFPTDVEFRADGWEKAPRLCVPDLA